MNGWGTMTTPPPTPVPGLDIGALALGVPVPGDVWFTTPPPLPAYSALAPFADMAPTMAPGPHHLPEGHFATGIVPPKPVPHLLAKAPAGAPGPALPLVHQRNFASREFYIPLRSFCGGFCGEFVETVIFPTEMTNNYGGVSQRRRIHATAVQKRSTESWPLKFPRSV